jgi:molecular chaperone DnaK (HSP70)
MAERSSVVASNYWHKPGISVTFRHDHESPAGSVHVEIGMDDFLQALAEELSHPLKQFTRTRQAAAVKQAYLSALEKVKEATNQVA